MSSILEQLEALKAAEKQKIEARRARIKGSGGSMRKSSTSINSAARRSSARRSSKELGSVTKDLSASSASIGSTDFSSTGSIPLPGDYTETSDVSSVTSDISQVSGSVRSRTEVSVSTVDPGFRQTMTVDTIWEQVKQLADYESQLGEEIIMQMMELDPACRKDMGITTLRSERFAEVAKILVGIVDVVVCLVGPDMVDQFEEELLRIGRQCEYEGIRVQLLGTSISKAVQLVLCDKLKPSDVDAWKTVFDHVSWKMLPATSDAFQAI